MKTSAIVVCALLAFAPPAGAAPVLPFLAAPVGLLAGQGDRDVNQTKERFAVHATDLGLMWRDSRGRVAIAFGDTYGAGWTGPGAGPETADWRFNVLGHSTDKDLTDGMRLDSMVVDRPGHAKQLIGKDPAVTEVTVIPTAGISVGGRDYLHYMSVREWGPPGTWTTNYSGLAYSDDGGENWVKAPARWPNSGGAASFQLGAFTRDADWVYLFGTPNGRLGNAFIARVAPARVLDVAAYSYWSAAGWSPDPAAVIPVMNGQVGELSVQYNGFLGKWVAMHLDERRTAIVLRTAPSPTGPWTGGEVVAHARDNGGLYGGFMHPDSAADIYFTLSRWTPYHSELMRLRLAGRSLDANLAQDGGFEDSPGAWQVAGHGGVDLGKGLSRTGSGNGWVRHDSGWNDLHTQVVAQPGQRYRLSGWLRTSGNNTDGYFGVRAGGRVVAEQKYGSLPGYTRLAVEFTADAPSLDVFAGLWAVHGDTWVQVDDVLLEHLG